MRYAARVTRTLFILAAALTACTPPPAAPAPPTAAANADPEPRAEDALYQCQKAQGDIAVSFAPAVKLADLVVWAEAFTCKRFVYRSCLGDERLTIAAPRTMGAPEAWDLFVSSVESIGLSVKLRGETVALVGDAPCPHPPERLSAYRPATDAREHRRPDPIDTAGRIHKIDDVTYEIDRGLIDEILADPMKIARGARIVPSIQNGQPHGFKLYAIRPSSFYAQIGLRNGDTMTAINGMDLTSPDKALDIYAKVRSATTVSVSLTRRGKPINITYKIH